MTNLLAETHEDGLFVPNWGTIGTTSPTRSVIVPNPQGTGKVMKVTGQTTTPRRFPYIDLPFGKTELYGSFQWRWGQDVPGGLKDTVGSNVFDNVLIGGKPVAGASNYNFFSVCLFGDTSPTPGIRMSMGDMFYDGSGGSGTRFTMVVANVLSKTAWHTVDWHISIGATAQTGIHGSTGAPIYGAPVTGRLRIDCGATTTTSGTAHRYNAQPIDIGSLWVPDSPGPFECYLDNIAVNDTAGSINSTWICGSPFPGGGYEGIVQGPSIAPAPEKLPHTIDYRDFPNHPENQARALAKKLQENFDSIERQLLALDPDNQDSANPIR